MLVLGLDPGSIHFGVGIICREGNRFQYVHSEVIHLAEPDFNRRMASLWKRLREITAAHEIGAAAMEEGFLGKNVHTLTLLAMVRGLVMAALIERSISLATYSPREVKLALTGYGSASKEQVGRMVATILNLRQGKRIGPDEGDALAVAYCHAAKLR